MEREAKRLIRHCKAETKAMLKAPVLEDIIAVHLTDELMDQFKVNFTLLIYWVSFLDFLLQKCGIFSFKTHNLEMLMTMTVVYFVCF